MNRLHYASLCILTLMSMAGCQPTTTVTTPTSNVPAAPPVITATPAPLMVAAREGKVDVNVRDERGNTPLIEAARYGHDDTAKALIDHGAEIEAKNNDNQTALMLAVQNDHKSVVKVLSEAGAKE